MVRRLLTENSIKLGAIAAEKFSRPQRSALEEIIAKRCTIDRLCSQRKCFALPGSDLVGCYDRIIHTASALSMLRIGIIHGRIKAMFQSIQKMSHRIKTVYGDSNFSYGG